MKTLRYVLILALLIECPALLSQQAEGGPPAPPSAQRQPLSVLSGAAGPEPDPRDYITVKTRSVPIGAPAFNGVPAAKRAKLRDITITGIDLTFGGGDARQPLNDLDGSKPGNDDIATLTIIAQDVTLHRRLYLPGTSVTIIARSLNFRDADPTHPGCIDTTPVAFPTPATSYVDAKGKNVSPGQPGLDGQPAGDIRLLVSRVTDIGTTRFVLDGGKGQDPGKGRNGANGTPARAQVWRDYKGRKRGQVFHDVIYVHLQGVFDAQRAFGKKVPDLGSNFTPSNGENAVPGGQPGGGGHGGMLITTPALARNLTRAVRTAPGSPGAASPAYRGGSSGAPGRWRKIIDDGFNTWETSHGTARPGNNAAGKIAQAGKPGGIKAVVFDKGWLDPAVAEAYLNYLRDAYLNGRIDLARGIAVQYLRPVIGDKVDVQSDPQLAAIHGRILTLARQLRSGLDYFGNPPGWVPMLSLEVMYRNYQSQIDSAMRILSLSHWMEAHWTDVQQRRQSGEQLIQQKLAEVRFYSDAYNKAQQMLPFLTRELTGIESQTSEVVQQLGDVERELAQQFKAEDELRKVAKDAVSGLRSAAEMWSFTGGAPAFASIVALSMVEGQLEAKGPSGSDTATADALNKLSAQDELEAARMRFKQLSIVNARSPEALKDDLKKLSVVLSAATREQITQGLSAGAVSIDQARLQEVQSRSPRFKRLFNKATELVTRKMLFAEKIAETYAVMDMAADGIAQSRAAVSALRAALDDEKIDPTTRLAIEQMQSGARDRLIEYKYYMARAYEYRMLKPCPVDYRSNRLFDQLARYFTPSGEETPNAPFKTESDLYKNLSAVYEQDLDELKDQIIREYGNYRVNSLVSQESLQLTRTELAQLNSSGEVTIDLGKRVVGDDDRNCRIVSIEPRSDRTKIVAGAGRRAKLQLTMEPADWCELRWQDRAYVFKYGLQREVSLARWGFSWDSGDPGQIRPFVASGDQRDVLNATGIAGQTPRVEFRPGARTLITLRMDTRPEGAAEIQQLGMWVYVDHNKARSGG